MYDISKIEELEQGWDGKNAAPPDAICIRNAFAFLNFAIGFKYIPNSVKPIALTDTFGAIGVTYFSNRSYGYFEFNHDGRYGLMLSRVQLILDAEQDEDYYFKSFIANKKNFKYSIVKVYEYLNKAP